MALEGGHGGNSRDAAAAAAVVTAPAGPAPRQERRSQSFAYDTNAARDEHLTHTILTQPSQGWVTNNGDGTFSFDPGLDFRDLKAGETRRISFSYQVSDGRSRTETESATLTVTGAADGTLTIEAATGNASRRAVPPRPATTAGEIETPGFADEPTGALAVARGGDQGVPPNEGSDGILPGGDAPSGESPATDGPDFGETDPSMATALRDLGQQAAEPMGPEPDPQPWIHDPLADETDADPFNGDAVLQDAEEPLAAPVPAPDPRGGLGSVTPERLAPADRPLQPEDISTLIEPRFAKLEPAPPEPAPPEPAPLESELLEPEGLEPEPKSDGRGPRVTVLAQPPEGRVNATDDGGFTFVPGADFPDLAVGELEQVSFTCEATDAEGVKSIVIASLTVAGTSEGPEVCDVAYRPAQGNAASQPTTPTVDGGQSDDTARGSEADPGAGTWPQPTSPPDLIPRGDEGESGSGADGAAQPGHSGSPVEAEAPRREPVAKPVAESVAETLAETLAEAEPPPLWPQDPGAGGASGRDAESLPRPSADDGARRDFGDVPGMSALHDGPQPDPSAARTAGDDGYAEDSYRGAVAAEAVAAFLPDDFASAAATGPDTGIRPNSEPEDFAPGPAPADASSQDGIGPDAQTAVPVGPFGAPDPHRPMSSNDHDARDGGFAAPADSVPEDLSAAESGSVADRVDDVQASDNVIEGADVPRAAAEELAGETDLTLDAADEDMDEAAELSDFTLSQDTVVEKSDAGTVVGQVLVAGAEQGSRFIFDLQNDAGGRFDINPRTGKITVADGALLDHADADSHAIMVQVIAHSGVSCRKNLTINVLPAGAGPAVEPPAAPPDAIAIPVPGSLEAARGHVPLPENAREAMPLAGDEADPPDDAEAGGSVVDTLHLDGVTGGPGLGGWALELTGGVIVETNHDNLTLSENSSGIVILDGCPVKVAFEGVERIDW